MGFLILCKNCGKSIEFQDGFYKKEKDIQVYDSGELLVSIHCVECGNEVVSHYDDDYDYDYVKDAIK